jgi:hypothetical protein
LFSARDQGLSHLARELFKQYGNYCLKDIPDNTYLHYAQRFTDYTDISASAYLTKLMLMEEETGGGTEALPASMRNNV